MAVINDGYRLPYSAKTVNTALFISFLHHFLPQLEMLPLQRLLLAVELFEFEIRLPHLVGLIRDALRDQLPQLLARGGIYRELYETQFREILDREGKA